MKMKVMIPKIHRHSEKQLTKIVSNAALIPKDCAKLVVDFCDLNFTEMVSNKHMNEDKLVTMYNKLPRWNPQINAYTLEFGGRALVPSVHNFQLVNEAEDVVLQLGKVSDEEFNVDFAFPLSSFQAFSICLSVIDRTFVWD